MDKKYVMDTPVSNAKVQAARAKLTKDLDISDRELDKYIINLFIIHLLEEHGSDKKKK